MASAWGRYLQPPRTSQGGSGAFLNLGNVVGEKAVRLLVNRHGSLFGGRVDQAEDRAGAFVEPVLEVVSTQDTEHRATVMALRSASRRVLTLGEEAAELESELETIVSRVAPRLLKEFGVGVVTAAQILCAWSHPGRVRSEAAFASLAGAAPIPASSGQTVRYRLNRGGDRQLNRALHTAVLSRLQRHPETRAYAARRTEEGKTLREIKRCLKRHLARRIYKLLESGDAGLAA